MYIDKFFLYFFSTKVFFKFCNSWRCWIPELLIIFKIFKFNHCKQKQKFYKNLTKFYRLNEINQEDYNSFVKLLKNSKKNNIYFFGNGGSSSISSHVSVDFLNIGYKSINFNDHNLITCLSNDFGYENWIIRSLQNHANKNEILILISSSGMSKNIIKVAKFAKKEDENYNFLWFQIE